MADSTDDTALNPSGIPLRPFYEGGDAGALLRHLAALKESHVRVMTVLALNDAGKASFDKDLARKVGIERRRPLLAGKVDLEGSVWSGGAPGAAGGYAINGGRMRPPHSHRGISAGGSYVFSSAKGERLQRSQRLLKSSPCI